MALTVRPFLWHIDYFKRPGARFYPLFLAAISAAALGAPVYQRLRRSGFWRYEPALLAGLPLAAFVFYEPRATLATAWIFLTGYAAGRLLRKKLGFQPGDKLLSINGQRPRDLIDLQFLVGEEELVRILTEPRNAIIKQYQKFFKMENCALEFTPEALRELSRQALRRETGARALRAVIEDMMIDIMFDLPSLPPCSYTVTPEVVRGQAVLLDQNPARARKRDIA